MKAIHHPGYEGFLRTEQAWRELSGAARSVRFFNAYEWYAAFFAHLLPPDEPIGVIELQCAGRCVGLFPYHQRRIRRGGLDLTVLCLPASPHLVLADALLADTFEARAALNAIRKCLAQEGLTWHALLLPAVREDSHGMRLGLALGRRAIMRSAGGSRFFDATQPYGTLTGQFAGPLRKNLRKGMKRLEQTGAVEFLSVRGADARMPWAFERFLALEASGWKGEAGAGSAIALRESVTSFYRVLAQADGAELRAEINLLCLDGTPIAGQFATVCRSHRSIHKIAYDESFRHASPGTLLMAHAVQLSCEDETIHSLSLVTDMPWMEDWKASRAAVYEVWIAKSALFAFLARAVLHIRELRTAPRRPSSAPPKGSSEGPSRRDRADDEHANQAAAEVICE